MLAGSIATFAGWSVLPNVITDFLVNLLDKSVGSSAWYTPAPKGTPGYLLNRKRVYTAVIAVYLAYTVQQAIVATSTTTWYDILGVAPNAAEADLKAASRLLARRYHPDKAGPNAGAAFIVARQAYDHLSDESRRTAYDRFGGSVAAWKGCVTPRDFLHHGLRDMFIWYGMTFSLSWLLNYFRQADAASHWRTFAFVVLFAAELNLLALPSSQVHADFDRLFPGRLAFQHVALVRQFWITLSLALNQLIPLWVSARRERLSEEQAQDMRITLEQAFVASKEVEGMAVYAAQQQQQQEGARQAGS